MAKEAKDKEEEEEEQRRRLSRANIHEGKIERGELVE